MKKKILFIATGGTFSAIKSAEGLKPHFLSKELLNFFPEAKKIADIDSLQFFHLDSTNIHPRHWTDLAKKIFENYSKYDGFVIGHGTDTMHYSAAAIFFALPNNKKPIVFTGSTFSLEEKNSDAKQNFLNSLKVVTNDKIKEVCICFQRKIIKGTRANKILNEATKILNKELEVFTSINEKFIGEIIDEKIVINKNYSFPKISKNQLDLKNNFDTNIGYIKLYPGIESNILDFFQDKKAIIIEAFAVGNIPFDYSDWLNQIKKFKEKGIPIFITTQNRFGEVDMELYEVGQKAMKAGAISCGNILPETVVVKLMWILGNFPNSDVDEIKKLFVTI